jgi:hypothetical protein
MARFYSHSFLCLFILFSGIFLLFTPQVYAINADIGISPDGNPFIVKRGTGDFTITFKSISGKPVFEVPEPGWFGICVLCENYTFVIGNPDGSFGKPLASNPRWEGRTATDPLTMQFKVSNAGHSVLDIGTYKFRLYKLPSDDLRNNTDQPDKIEAEGSFKVVYETGAKALDPKDGSFKRGDKITVYAVGIDPNKPYAIWWDHKVEYECSGKFTGDKLINNYPPPNGTQTAGKCIVDTGHVGPLNTTPTLCMDESDTTAGSVSGLTCLWQAHYNLVDTTQPTPTPGGISNGTGDNGAGGINGDISATPLPPHAPCAKRDATTGECLLVDSAFGQLATDPQSFITMLFGVFLSISGAVALLTIIAAGYRMMTSQGNPETVKSARELLTSAIVGLIFLVFSLVLLEIIGIDILHIPGFSQ